MRISPGGPFKVWSVAAGLALAIASGCYQEERAATSAPDSPLPTSDSSRPVQPPPPGTDQGGETRGTSNVDKELSKDRAESPIKGEGPTTTAPPADRPTPAKPDAGKAGRP